MLSKWTASLYGTKQTVLHDWSDEKAVDILRNTATSMEKGYSRILIHEIVVDEEPSSLVTSPDLHMMMVNSAFERTERDWVRITQGADLQLTKLWKIPWPRESIIGVT